MTDPIEARLAAALHDTLVGIDGCWHVHPTTLKPLPESSWECHGLMAGMAMHDPTLAADLALGAAVRESGLVDAAKALDRFMRQPDENEDGTPADWAPGLDAIGDFQNATAIIKAAKEASDEPIITAHTPPFDTVAKGDRP